MDLVIIEIHAYQDLSIIPFKKLIFIFNEKFISESPIVDCMFNLLLCSGFTITGSNK